MDQPKPEEPSTLQKALTRNDDITPDVLLLLCIFSNILGWGLTAWTVFYQSKPFSFMDFGTGTAALIAAYGLAKLNKELN